MVTMQGKRNLPDGVGLVQGVLRGLIQVPATILCEASPNDAEADPALWRLQLSAMLGDDLGRSVYDKA